MGQVVVTVNGRAFPISCDDGQEARIRRLAQYVDAKINDFVKTIGQVGEARLLLMAAIMIADELSDANEVVLQERGRARSSTNSGTGNNISGNSGAAADRGGEGATNAAGGIRGIAQRIETIAARLESS